MRDEAQRDGAAGGGSVPWRTLLAVLTVALVVRIGAVETFQGFASPPDAGAFPDQIDYEGLAWELREGRGYRLPGGEPTARRAPGTSLAILPAYLAFGREPAAARAWFCVLSAATCLAAGWFAARAFGALAGVLAASLLAFDPAHFYYALHFVSEVPFCFFAAAGAVASLEALRARGAAARLLHVAAGAAWGMAALTRPQMVLAVPVGLVLAVLALRRRGKGPLVHVLAAGAVAALLVGGWIARNALVVGTPTLTTASGVTFFGAHNEHVLDSYAGGWIPIASIPRLLPNDWPRDEEERARVAWREGLAFVREHAREMPGLFVHKLRRAWTPWAGTENETVRWTFAAAWWLLVPAAALGLVAAWLRDRVASGILLVQLAVFLATVLVFYGHWRFRHSIEPVIATWAAAFLAAAFERLRRAAGAT